MTQNELMEILFEHTRWAKRDGGKRANLRCEDLSSADLSGADLSWAYLSGADLSWADLSSADLNGANLSGANLSGAYLSSADLSGAYLSSADLSGAYLIGAELIGADLSSADLSGAYLSGADLNGANLSGAKGVLSQAEFLQKNYERDNDGYIAYKTFGSIKNSPKNWVIEPGSILCENVNFSRTHECGCGINVAPLKWVKENTDGVIWRVRIRWEWLPGVCVPYMSDGKIRCEKVELIETVER